MSLLLKSWAVKPTDSLRKAILRIPLTAMLPLSDHELVPYEIEPAQNFCPDVYGINLKLHYYLFHWFKPKHALKLKSRCHRFIAKLHHNHMLSPNELSKMVHDFYADIGNLAMEYGATDSEVSLDEFLENVESFVCVNAYEILFCPSDEEDLDLSLQQRIRSLYWTTQGFLETALNFESESVVNLLVDSMVEISNINSCKKIKEKLGCLVKCTDKISEAIRKSTGIPASADELIPAIIYVILTSNPTLIQSNLKFIERFSSKSRTTQGESGYQFTNICSAIYFIQQLDAKSLQMSKDVFEEFLATHSPA